METQKKKQNDSYGALLWSLGKVVQTPEVMRVYISSFWDQPYQCTEAEALFNLERDDLLGDLRSLPRNSAIRKVLCVFVSLRACLYVCVCVLYCFCFNFFSRKIAIKLHTQFRMHKMG